MKLLPFAFDMPADLLVRPSQLVLALFKYSGLVRSSQVFSHRVWDARQMQLPEQINYCHVMDGRGADVWCVLVTVLPGDDSAHRQLLMLIHRMHLCWLAAGGEMHIWSALNYLVKMCSDEGGSICTHSWKRFMMKFMIHMDTRQADKVCLITHPSGPQH